MLRNGDDRGALTNRYSSDRFKTREEMPKASLISSEFNHEHEPHISQPRNTGTQKEISLLRTTVPKADASRYGSLVDEQLPEVQACKIDYCYNENPPEKKYDGKVKNPEYKPMCTEKLPKSFVNNPDSKELGYEVSHLTKSTHKGSQDGKHNMITREITLPESHINIAEKKDSDSERSGESSSTHIEMSSPPPSEDIPRYIEEISNITDLIKDLRIKLIENKSDVGAIATVVRRQILRSERTQKVILRRIGNLQVDEWNCDNELDKIDKGLDEVGKMVARNNERIGKLEKSNNKLFKKYPKKMDVTNRKIENNEEKIVELTLDNEFLTRDIDAMSDLIYRLLRITRSLQQLGDTSILPENFNYILRTALPLITLFNDEKHLDKGPGRSQPHPLGNKGTHEMETPRNETLHPKNEQNEKKYPYTDNNMFLKPGEENTSGKRDVFESPLRHKEEGNRNDDGHLTRDYEPKKPENVPTIKLEVVDIDYKQRPKNDLKKPILESPGDTSSDTNPKRDENQNSNQENPNKLTILEPLIEEGEEYSTSESSDSSRSSNHEISSENLSDKGSTNTISSSESLTLSDERSSIRHDQGNVMSDKELKDMLRKLSVQDQPPDLSELQTK